MGAEQGTLLVASARQAGGTGHRQGWWRMAGPAVSARGRGGPRALLQLGGGGAEVGAEVAEGGADDFGRDGLPAQLLVGGVAVAAPEGVEVVPTLPACDPEDVDGGHLVGVLLGGHRDRGLDAGGHPGIPHAQHPGSIRPASVGHLEGLAPRAAADLLERLEQYDSAARPRGPQSQGAMLSTPQRAPMLGSAGGPIALAVLP